MSTDRPMFHGDETTIRAGGSNSFNDGDWTAEHHYRNRFLDAAERYLKARTKLVAVRELHKRRPFEPGVDLVHFRQSGFPDQCNHCRTDYPCPTITALEDR